MNEKNKKLIRGIKEACLSFGIITLLGGIFLIFIGFEKLPLEKDATVVNGVFDRYEKDSGEKNGVDKIYLKDGIYYEVPYFEDYQTQRSAFIKNIKQGQPINLWIYLGTNSYTVLAIKSNNTTYLSYNEAINYYKESNEQSKTLGLVVLPISVILLNIYWWMLKKSKS